MPSNTDPSKSYLVEVTPTSQSCNCIGFTMRHTCRHLTRTLDHISANHLPLDIPDLTTLPRLTPPSKPKTRADILKEEKLQHLKEMYGY